MEKGRITPPDTDRETIIHFVLSGGKVTEKPKVRPTATLVR
jgi:hypothetical protein